MDILNNILDYIARTNLFNFIIFAGIIIFLVKKLNVSAKMEDATAVIKETIKESENVKAESETNLSGIEKSMANLNDEIDVILSDSENRANIIGSKILEDADRTALVVKNNTEKALYNDKVLLKNDLIRRASLASVEVAKAHITEELIKNAELHEKLINESIDALEGVKSE